jgi:cytoskeletal protein CcmA (bactofilin family)
MFKKQNKLQNRIDSLIGAGTKISGSVSFVGGLRVDGEILGDVVASGDEASTLVISEPGHITGEIHVSHLVVNGTIDGPVHSSEFMELQAKSRITGDVHYNRLEMHLGAVIEGRLIHKSSETRTVELKLATSNSATA